jgi:hypothetical protein
MLKKEERSGGTVDNKRRGSLVPSLFKLQVLKQDFLFQIYYLIFMNQWILKKTLLSL